MGVQSREFTTMLKVTLPRWRRANLELGLLTQTMPVELTTPEHFLSNTQRAMITFQITTLTGDVKETAI